MDLHMTRFTAILLSLFVASLGAAGCSGADGQSNTDTDVAADVVDAVDTTDDSVDVADVGDDEGSVDSGDDSVDGVDDTGIDAPPDAPEDVGPDGFFDPDVTDDSGEDSGPSGPVEIYSIDPVRGPVVGGTPVLVLGYGFTPETDILINGRRLESFDFVDEETILGRTPENAAGTWDLKVIGTGGDAVLEDAFTYFATLAITDVEPDAGPTRGGVPVTVRGTGFTDDARVSVDGQLGIDVRYVDSTRIEFVVPPGIAGLADVRVTSVNGSVLAADAFRYYEDITLEAVVPAAGSTVGGYQVDLIGAGFLNDVEVYFGESLAVASLIDANTLRVTAPAGAAGLVDVRVEAAGRLGDVLAGGFLYVAPEGVEGIDAVLPAVGPTAGGNLVTIAGRGLADADVVRFGPSTATIRSAGENSVVVTAPARAAGLVDVTVEVDGITYTAVDAYRFEPGISVSEVSPSSGPIEGGSTVTISGAGFTADSTVRFGAVGARSVRYIGAATLEAVTPPNTLGFVDVSVSSSGRTGRLQNGFRYTTIAGVSTMTPTRGSIAGNTYVVIRGSGFDADTTAFFDGIESPSVTLLDPSTIAVRTPPHAAGAATVTVNVGGETLTLRDRFNYYNPFSDALGWWGGPINGSVNVTVIDITTGSFVPNAFVTLHLRAADSRYTGVTDANGQVTISYPEVVGPQNVSASAAGFSSVTVTNVDAENVIIALASPVPPSPGGGGEEWPIISGTLTGLDKITDPGPNEVLIAVIRNTTDSPGGQNPPGTGYTEVVYTDGETSYPYSLPVRPGDMAVVAICGVYNEVSGEFTPLYMGVARRIFTRMGEAYTYNLDCNISMDQFIDFKFIASPLAPGGAEVNQAIPYLDFGGEGGIDLLRIAEGTTEIITGDHMAPLDAPELEGVRYYMVGQAVPRAANLPFSVAYARDVTDPDALVTFGPLAPPPTLRYPAAPARQLVERRFEWALETSVRPDFYYAFITDLAQEVTYWEVWLPGDETSFNLPFFPPDSPVEDLPREPLVFIVLAIDAISFDYDAFEFNDFGAQNWNSYSANGWVIYN
jgi:hypothetical protein